MRQQGDESRRIIGDPVRNPGFPQQRNKIRETLSQVNRNLISLPADLLYYLPPLVKVGFESIPQGFFLMEPKPVIQDMNTINEWVVFYRHHRFAARQKPDFCLGKCMSQNRKHAGADNDIP